MPRLRRSDCSRPGIRRRRRGRGFSYHWEDSGNQVQDPEVLERIEALVLPPAWADVWICPYPNGHLQAVGTDAAGRKQYRYHDSWRTRRDAEKFDSMLQFAQALPDMRVVVQEHLESRAGLDRDRVLACTVRLLDRGFFRIGTEVGRSGDLETFGLTTMRKDHVSVSGNEVSFEYLAKGGTHRVHSVVDAAVCEIVQALKRRRSGGDQLLAFRHADDWVEVSARDVNLWIKDVTSGDFSAKDFRTWTATVLAAVALAVSGAAAATASARKRAEARASREVGYYLGNTPTVARNSYIDPRVFDRYRSGWTIAGVLTELGDVEADEPSIQTHVEAAVLDLLQDNTGSAAIERVTTLAS
ncbi:MAG: DNA topoisomerase IB [Nitriliruptorales bacterium]|nr:DNA topoisomerase IB [Nitriliruptorales bacterium]